MSFFPGYITSSQPSSFSPLFRLLDDFEQHQSGNPSSSSSHNHRNRGFGLRTFTPKFDVKELETTYELHGELPGIEQKDVEIEFTDAQTLHIKGRTEKSYTRGTPPAGFVEDSDKPAQIESGEGKGHHVTPHKATVEDAEDGNENTTVAKSSDGKGVEKKKEGDKAPEAKYWVSERSIGEFSRSFTFPSRVDQDGVKASMKNGILSIVVPKAKKHEGRKIAIQ